MGDGKPFAVETLAAKAGVHRANVYKWLKGEAAPEGANLAAAADVLGTTMDWLWGRTDEGAPAVLVATAPGEVPPPAGPADPSLFGPGRSPSRARRRSGEGAR